MKLKTLKAKLPKSIKGITVLKTTTEQNAAGGELGRVVVKRKRKTKRQTKGLVRVLERMARRGASSNRSMADTYLSRHRRSNKKRRDGWLRDYTYSWTRANRKGAKKFKLSKLFG